MHTEIAGSILFSLRRIIRAIDQHNKQLSVEYNLTVPQLVSLRHLLLHGPSSPGNLAKAVYLSQATITGILDRLEVKGLIERHRHQTDRRKLIVSLTQKGDDFARSLPWPLQERFANSLDALDETEIASIDATLKRIVTMMEAPPMLVWPFGEDIPAEAQPPEDP